ADLLGQRLGLVEDLLAKLPLALGRHVVELGDLLLDRPGSLAQLPRDFLAGLGPLGLLRLEALGERIHFLLEERLEGVEALLRLGASVGGLLEQPLLEPREPLLEVVNLRAEEDVADLFEVSGTACLGRRRRDARPGRRPGTLA